MIFCWFFVWFLKVRFDILDWHQNFVKIIVNIKSSWFTNDGNQMCDGRNKNDAQGGTVHWCTTRCGVRCTFVFSCNYFWNLFVELFCLGLIKVFGLVAFVKVVSLVEPMEKKWYTWKLIKSVNLIILLMNIQIKNHFRNLKSAIDHCATVLTNVTKTF